MKNNKKPYPLATIILFSFIAIYTLLTVAFIWSVYVIIYVELFFSALINYGFISLVLAVISAIALLALLLFLNVIFPMRLMNKTKNKKRFWLWYILYLILYTAITFI